MGVLEQAADKLRSEKHQFVPALDEARATSSTWTLGDALLDGCGCHRKAGPLAYWEHHEIHDTLVAAFELVAAEAGATDGRAWSNEPQRSLAEVLEVLSAAAAKGDLRGPAVVRMRPWCKASDQFTCRIPFIPLAALMHAWKLAPVPLQAFVDRYDLKPSMDPWALLDLVDPDIVGTEPPEGIADAAGELRAVMERWPTGQIHNPSHLFTTLAASNLDLGPEEFVQRASQMAPPRSDATAAEVAWAEAAGK